MPATRPAFFKSPVPTDWIGAIGASPLFRLALIVCLSAFLAAIQTLYLSHGFDGYPLSVRLWTAGALFLIQSLLLLTVLRVLLAVPAQRLYLIVAVCAVAGIVTLFWPTEKPVVSATTADGQQVPVGTELTFAWNATHRAFLMHPPFDDAHTLNDIAIPVPKGASRIRLAVSKPKPSVVTDKGAYIGDGVDVDVSVSDRGRVRSAQTLTIRPHELIHIGWKTLDVPLRKGDKEVRITVRSGPPGSNTVYDTTLAAAWFSFPGPHPTQLGRYSFGLVIAALLLAAAATSGLSNGAAATWKARGRFAWNAVTNPSVIAFCAGLLAVSAIHQALSNTVLSYDPVRYFLNSEIVANSLRTGSVMSVLRDAVATNPDEYSLWPAVLPGAVSLLFGQYSLVSYLLSMAIVYAIPTAFACSALGYWLVRPQLPDSFGRAMPERANLAALGAFAAFLLVPMFVSVFLWPFPDIGGVAAACALILTVSLLCGAIVDPQNPATNDWQRLVAWTVLAVFLAAALFLFRRWYVFLVIGVACAAALWLPLAWYRGNFRASGFLSRLSLAAAVGILTLLALLADVIVLWLATPAEHNYMVLYSSYWTTYANMQQDFLGAFGLAVPLFSVGLCSYLIARTSRALPFILLIGSLIGFFGFMKLESPSPHHLYLLMPLFSGSVAGGAIWLARVWGVRAAGVSVLAAGLIAVGLIALPPPVLSLAVPTNEILEPPRRSDLPALARLVNWTIDNVGPGESYCVVSSSNTFNATIVDNFWQRAPELRDKLPPNAWLGEVDSRDGPPTRQIRDCNLMLVSDPVQFHLLPVEQRTVAVVADAFLKGQGIATAFKQEGPIFLLQGGVKIIPFRRIRPIDEAEYQALREAFFQAKGSEADQYRARYPSLPSP